MILAIDPGPTKSAFVRFDGKRPVEFGKWSNEQVRRLMRAESHNRVIIEMIASYGMPVGAEVFETCLWIGRFMEAAGGAERLTRKQVSLYLCNSPRANDATVRQAILDRFGGKDAAIGRKANPGPLYGITGDCWAALAVAITAIEIPARYCWPPITTTPQPGKKENA